MRKTPFAEEINWWNFIYESRKLIFLFRDMVMVKIFFSNVSSQLISLVCKYRYLKVPTQDVDLISRIAIVYDNVRTTNYIPYLLL